MTAKWEYEIRRIDERFALLGTNLDWRFHQANEVRGSLEDLSSQMATRREMETFKDQYNLGHEALRSEMGAVERRLTLSEGRALGVSMTGKVLVAALSSLLVLMGLYTAVEATRHAHSPLTVTVTAP